MKVTANILIFVLIIGLYACNSTTPGEKHDVNNTVMVGSGPIKKKKNDKTNKQDRRKDCTRGQAEPIIKKKVYPNTTFVLQPDSISAIETVNFNNGDKLIISNCGCESYVLIFRFETSRFKQDTTNLDYWFRSADLLVREMLGGIDSPIPLEKGLNKLIDHVNNDRPNKYKNLKLGEQIDIEGDESTTVSVYRIEKLKNEKYAVEIIFGIGPL